MQDAIAEPVLPSDDLPMMLISGGRRSASFNSWTHNLPALMDKLRGNWATIHPEDAARLGIASGDRVRVTSALGAVDIAVVCEDSIRPGVVMIHQFWGHTYPSGMRTSRTYPGVNVNRLHDDGVRDRFTGMPVFNGTPCRVERLSESSGMGDDINPPSSSARSPRG